MSELLAAAAHGKVAMGAAAEHAGTGGGGEAAIEHASDPRREELYSHGRPTGSAGSRTEASEGETSDDDVEARQKDGTEDLRSVPDAGRSVPDAGRSVPDTGKTQEGDEDQLDEVSISHEDDGF